MITNERLGSWDHKVFSRTVSHTRGQKLPWPFFISSHKFQQNLKVTNFGHDLLSKKLTNIEL